MPALRNTRRTRRTDTAPVRSVVVRGMVSIAVLVAFFWLGVKAFNGVPGRGYSTIRAAVPQIGNVLRHDPVRIAGVRVGQVSARALAPNGEGLLTLQLEPGVHLPADTQIMIRANGLLGARYIQLIPGSSSQTLREGATIHGKADALTFGVPETLDVLDPATRKALGSVTDNVGQGLLGHGGELNQAIRGIDQQVRPFRRLVRTVLADPGAAKRLVPSVDAAMSTLAASRAGLTALPAVAAQVLHGVNDEGRALQQTLSDAPPALRTATSGLGNGQRLVVALGRLAAEAQVTLPRAPGGLRAAARLLRSTPTPLHRADKLLAAAAPAIPAVIRLTDAAKPVLGPLKEGLLAVKPILTRLGPYGCDIENFAAVFRSMTGFGGVGEGPNGPPGEFRVQIGVADLGQPLGVDTSKSGSRGVREALPGPCAHPSSTYPQVAGALRPGGGR